MKRRWNFLMQFNYTSLQVLKESPIISVITFTSFTSIVNYN